MSHFAVLVITDEPPTPEVLSRALQPFHEYECTGIRDEYVQFVDEDDEIRKEFAEQTYERLRSPAGELVDPNDDRFLRPATEDERKQVGSGGGWGTTWGGPLGYSKGIDGVPHVIDPAKKVGWELVTITGVDRHGSIEAWAEQQGYKQHEGRWGRWTNPNKKWDWWVVGGRYSGRLRVTGSSAEHDSAERRLLDLDAMKRESVEQRREMFEAALANDIKRTQHPREQLLETFRAYNVELAAALKRWVAAGSPGSFWDYLQQQQETVPALRDRPAMDGVGGYMCEIPEGIGDFEAWIQDAPALGCFAMLTPDGVWHERGRMGWWALVDGDIGKDAWFAKVDETLAAMKPEQHLTIVDCHI